MRLENRQTPSARSRPDGRAGVADGVVTGDAPVTAATEMVVVGRIDGAYGVRGWLRVTSYTDPVENLVGYRPWHLRPERRDFTSAASLVSKGGWRAVAVREIRPHGEGFRCSISGVADRDAAARWRGALVGVPETILPAPGEGEYYWRDLIGMAVTTLTGTPLGRVETLIATGANDALVVRDGERERLIPFIGQVAREVDVHRGVIVADWDPDF